MHENKIIPLETYEQLLLGLAESLPVASETGAIFTTPREIQCFVQFTGFDLSHSRPDQIPPRISFEAFQKALSYYQAEKQRLLVYPKKLSRVIDDILFYPDSPRHVRINIYLDTNASTVEHTPASQSDHNLLNIFLPVNPLTWPPGKHLNGYLGKDLSRQLERYYRTSLKRLEDEDSSLYQPYFYHRSPAVMIAYRPSPIRRIMITPFESSSKPSTILSSSQPS